MTAAIEGASVSIVDRRNFHCLEPGTGAPLFLELGRVPARARTWPCFRTFTTAGPRDSAILPTCASQNATPAEPAPPSGGRAAAAAPSPPATGRPRR